jgi:hypothetical protein
MWGSADLAAIARAIQIAAERAGRRAAQAGETRSDRWMPGSPADDRIGRAGRPADQRVASSNVCAQGALTAARSGAEKRA